GYTRAIEENGRAFVLAERRQWLRRLALNKLRDPVIYWPKFDTLPLAKGDVPHAILRRALPDADLSYRVVARVAGVGSLGRRRIVALAICEGARVAREAKAWLPSGLVWATGRSSLGYSAQKLLAHAVRSRDPFLQFHPHWIVRRLAPDCSRIELADLPRIQD